VTTEDRAASYPVGSSVTLEELARDPYAIYTRMQAKEPVSWVSCLEMYYVVRYEHVQAILRDPVRFVVGTPHSTLFDTFGMHMLTTDGDLHARYRAVFQPYFSPSAVREQLEQQIRGHVERLIEGFRSRKHVELRHSFAARLPILTMLSLLGLPLELEPDVRRWYDSFEEALANFRWDPRIRETADTWRNSVSSFSRR